MNPRFMPGGDKYESIKEDERRAFYDRIEEEKEHIVSVLKSVVSTWTENEFDNSNYCETWSFERFLDEHPEWNHEEIYSVIKNEMERVAGLCMRDAVVNIASGQGY